MRGYLIKEQNLLMSIIKALWNRKTPICYMAVEMLMIKLHTKFKKRRLDRLLLSMISKEN